MASYRQLPEVFRRLHPRFKTPWLSLVVFAGIAADPDHAARATSTSSARCTRSARCSRSRSRTRRWSRCAWTTRPAAERSYRARPNLRMRGRRLAAVRASSAGSRPALSFLVVVVQNADHALGRARLARGRVRRLRRLPAPRRARAARARRCGRRPRSARRWRSSTGNILVPVVAGRASEEAIDVACRLAAERGARDRRAAAWSRCRSSCRSTDELPSEEDAANARARRGARDRRLVRRGRRRRASCARRAPAARSSTRPSARSAEIIVMGAPRRR